MGGKEKKGGVRGHEERKRWGDSEVDTEKERKDRRLK